MSYSPEILIVDHFLDKPVFDTCQEEIKKNKDLLLSDNRYKSVSFSRYYPEVNTLIPNVIDDNLFSPKIHSLIENFHDGYWKLFNERLATGFEVQVTLYQKKLENQYTWHVDHLVDSNQRYFGLRVLNYILYINDVSKGGELEIADHFTKYDPYRKSYNISQTIKPKANRLVIVPSWLIHRVKPMLTDEKRITINGHIFIQNIEQIQNQINSQK